MEIQSVYQKALKFGAQKHAETGQTIPGTNIPYMVHLSNVAMEILITARHTEDFDLAFAVQVALLHDLLEDTQTAFEELASGFGIETAEAVSALTKSNSLKGDEKMTDSLHRIKIMRKEVWAVKLADRITNLQKPPDHWDRQKKNNYKRESEIILEYLAGGNPYLENRLKNKILEYQDYIDPN
jgi:guanosine-3',5'-bis(diphosphate) 3'-pyrophosphohydrolase